jgi:uncharacterized protein YneF (UPF0154 family)
MGGDLREIVDTEQASRLFSLLALLLPPLCLLCGLWYGGRHGNQRRGAVNGLLVGVLGPLNWVLWRVYNAITEANGLDTVRNLVINLVVFLAVGAVAGIIAGVFIRRNKSAPEEVPPTDNSQ